MLRANKIQETKNELESYILGLQTTDFQEDMECVNRACEPDVKPEYLVALFQRMQAHGISVDNRIGVGIFSGLAGISLMATAGISFFVTGGLSAYPSFAMFAGGLGLFSAGVGVPVVSAKKDGRIGNMEKSLLIQINEWLFAEKKYHIYVITELMIIKSQGETAKASNPEISQLEHCINTQIPDINGENVLYDICDTLVNNLLYNLAGSEMKPAIRHLIEVLTSEILKQDHFGDYIKIKLIIIFNNAKARDNIHGREKTERNVLLMAIINQLDNAATPDDIQATLHNAIRQTKNNSEHTSNDLQQLSNEFSARIAIKAESMQTADKPLWSRLGF